MTANEAKLQKKTLTCLEHQSDDETDAQDQWWRLRFCFLSACFLPETLCIVVRLVPFFS